MYYALRQDLTDQLRVTQYPSVEPSFLTGRRIDEAALDLPLRVRGSFDRAFPPTHYQAGRIPLFSTQLLETLAAAGVDNLQTFPAVVTGEDGTEWGHLRATQVLGLVSCADLDASDHSVLDPGDGDQLPPLVTVHELVLLPERVPADILFFRLAEDPSLLVCSDRVFEALAENGPEGGWGLLCDAVTDE